MAARALERALLALPRRARACISERLRASPLPERLLATDRTPSTWADLDILRLERRQLFAESRFLPLADLVGRAPLIDRTTPVGSMGSCFSERIKGWLVGNGYNYVQTSAEAHARAGSAAWGQVYNTFCLRQEVERALGRFDPPVRGWPLADGRIMSPYRHHVTWTGDAHMEAELASHRESARAAFEAARVFIITLGITEIWFDRRDGTTFVSVPPATVHDPSVHAFRTSTYDENLANLRRIRDGLRTLNPHCHLVVSVSPVPMRATFDGQHSVLVASARGKATLVTAARDFAEDADDTSYFPSFELVNEGFRNARHWDQRHIKASVIDQLMRVFATVYATGES